MLSIEQYIKHLADMAILLETHKVPVRVVCSSSFWNRVITDDFIQQSGDASGSQMAWLSVKDDAELWPRSSKCVLTCLPGVIWHITDRIHTGERMIQQMILLPIKEGKAKDPAVDQSVINPWSRESEIVESDPDGLRSRD